MSLRVPMSSQPCMGEVVTASGYSRKLSPHVLACSAKMPRHEVKLGNVYTTLTEGGTCAPPPP